MGPIGRSFWTLVLIDICLAFLVDLALGHSFIMVSIIVTIVLMICLLFTLVIGVLALEN